MTAASVLARGRVAAERLMTDACTVTYKTGATTQDETTGREVPVYATRFTSKCKVQARSVSVQAVEAGARMVATSTLEVHLPITAEAVEVDDVVEVTASVYDPQLVGQKFRVVAPVAKSHATSRRFQVEVEG